MDRNEYHENIIAKIIGLDPDWNGLKATRAALKNGWIRVATLGKQIIEFESRPNGRILQPQVDVVKKILARHRKEVKRVTVGNAYFDNFDTMGILNRIEQVTEQNELVSAQPNKLVEAQKSYTGWANVRTGEIISEPHATFHHKILKKNWREMGVDEVTAQLATDAYAGPAQREAYSKGWMRWFYDTGISRVSLNVSGPRRVLSKALPVTLKLIKEFQPRGLYVDEVDEDKNTAWRSVSLNAGDTPAIRKWFQERPVTEGYIMKVETPVDPDPVIVSVNPSPDNLMALLQKADRGKLRGLTDERGVSYWWDAYYMTHSAMKGHFRKEEMILDDLQGWWLGLDPKIPGTIFLAHASTPYHTTDIANSIPYLGTLLKDPRISPRPKEQRKL